MLRTYEIYRKSKICKKWPSVWVDTMTELFADGLTGRQVAEKMTEKFNVPFTAAMVNGRINRLEKELKGG